MSEASRPPDFISLEAHRDHEHPVEHWTRWLFVAALAMVALAALADVFGQHPSTSVADAPPAVLRVTAPSALRGGLVFQAKLEIVARRSIRQPTVVLASGWFENMSFNTILPEPAKTTSEGSDVALEFAALGAGQTLTVYIPFQVNPTTVGRRPQRVVLRDGNRPIAAVERTVTVFP